MSTITFTGNLTADPEVRFTPSGAQVARFTVLEDNPKRTEAGEWTEGEANRYDVEVWNGLAEHCAESLTTGARVVVAGKVTTQRWSDKDSGQARSRQIIAAKEVGYSLKFHTVQAAKATRSQVGDPGAAQEEQGNQA